MEPILEKFWFCIKLNIARRTAIKQKRFICFKKNVLWKLYLTFKNCVKYWVFCVATLENKTVSYQDQVNKVAITYPKEIAETFAKVFQIMVLVLVKYSEK